MADLGFSYKGHWVDIVLESDMSSRLTWSYAIDGGALTHRTHAFSFGRTAIMKQAVVHVKDVIDNIGVPAY